MLSDRFSATSEVGEAGALRTAELEEARHRRLRREFLAGVPDYPQGRFRGRGIVVPAGGAKYFTCAWVCVSRLRALGCRLPVQFWHLGPLECDDEMRALARSLDAECVDARRVAEEHPVRYLNGWELKPYSILHAPFEQVLLIDADNVPVRDPGYLFDHEAFVEHGAAFWPDYGRLAPWRRIWRICDVAYRDEPEFETGQILVDKRRCWRELQLTMHLNEHSDYYYQHVHGDKETFHMAWRILGSENAMPEWPIVSLTGTMCQHDFEGRRLFQHRNTAKWTVHGDNERVDGFEQEAECLEALAALARRWSGKVSLPGPTSDESRAAERELESIGRFVYHRVGFDARVIELGVDGLVTEGAAEMEQFWFVRDGADGVELCLAGKEVTCRLVRCPGGMWAGRWAHYERMPIVLEPEGGC